MNKVIGVIVLLITLFISGLWAYRLGGPKLSEQQAMQAAQYHADLAGGPESIATQAVLYPDNDVQSSNGHPFPYIQPGCPGWVIWFLCPPRSIWVVRVHTPGKGNYDVFIDANTGARA
jgi:peptidase YpeB-like protein